MSVNVHCLISFRSGDTYNPALESIHQDLEMGARVDSYQWASMLGVTVLTWAAAALSLYLKYAKGCRAVPQQQRERPRPRSYYVPELEMASPRRMVHSGEPEILNVFHHDTASPK